VLRATQTTGRYSDKAGGWIGAFINNWMVGRRETAARTDQFRKQQLEQFYGPLLAMHKEIRARSELRVKLQNAIDTLYIREMWRAGPGKPVEVSDEHLSAIMKNLQDENETFKEVLMPRYREMINVFREKMWLADPQTRTFFRDLVEFVDVWDKILVNKLPSSFAPAIGHT